MPPSGHGRLTGVLVSAAIWIAWLMVGVVPIVGVSWMYLADRHDAVLLEDATTSASSTAVVTHVTFGRGVTTVSVSFTTVDSREVDAVLLHGTDTLHVGQAIPVRYVRADPATVQDEPVAERLDALWAQDFVLLVICGVGGCGWLAFPTVQRRLHRRWARQDAEQDRILAQAPDRDVVTALSQGGSELTATIVDDHGERTVRVHDATFRYDRSGPFARVVINGSESTPIDPPGVWVPLVFRSSAVRRVVDRKGRELYIRADLR